MPQDKNSHFIPDNPKKKVVTKYSKIRASKVILKDSEAAWPRHDSIFGSLYFGKEPISQLRTAFPIEMVQSDPKVRLNCPMKMELHRPISRRSCSQVIEVFGSRSMSLSRRLASETPSSSSSSTGGKLSSSSAANSALSLVDRTLACCLSS